MPIHMYKSSAAITLPLFPPVTSEQGSGEPHRPIIEAPKLLKQGYRILARHINVVRAPDRYHQPAHSTIGYLRVTAHLPGPGNLNTGLPRRSRNIRNHDLGLRGLLACVLIQQTQQDAMEVLVGMPGLGRVFLLELLWMFCGSGFLKDSPV